MKMNIIKSTLLMGLALGCMPIAAQGTSAPYSPGITQDAVSYWLPKTKLTVTVTTRKSTFKPGEFTINGMPQPFGIASASETVA